MKYAMAVTLSVLLLSGAAYACCGHCGMGAGIGDHGKGVQHEGHASSGTVQADPDLASARKAIDERIANLRQTVQLRMDLAVSQLELQKFWLDKEPDAAKLSAMFVQIRDLQRKLAEVSGGWGCGGHTGTMRGCGMMGRGMWPGGCGQHGW